MVSDLESRTGTTLQVLLNDPTSPQAWHTFVNRYGPKIHGWCRKWGLQEADAQDITQDVLTEWAQQIHSFAYDDKYSFRGWLKRLTRCALSDYLRKGQRAGRGSGNHEIQERLETVQARDDLVKELEAEFDLELVEAAKVRVQLQVAPRDWQIFLHLAIDGRSGAEVAGELGMTEPAVFMAKCRVQKKLKEEVRHLEGAAPEYAEGTP